MCAIDRATRTKRRERDDRQIQNRPTEDATAYLTPEFGDILATLADYRTGYLQQKDSSFVIRAGVEDRTIRTTRSRGTLNRDIDLESFFFFSERYFCIGEWTDV